MQALHLARDLAERQADRHQRIVAVEPRLKVRKRKSKFDFNKDEKKKTSLPHDAYVTLQSTIGCVVSGGEVLARVNDHALQVKLTASLVISKK
jgi:hypothetical protein